MSWSARNIPDLTGRRAIVTGANSGIGYVTALELARAGAHVVLTARDRSRGEHAVRRLRKVLPDAHVELGELDLADLSSVRRFATTYVAEPVDILVNNAGVMALPRQTTVDGFEMQLGTNHLGHFALTGLLLPALTQRSAARVVTVGSIAHWWGALDFDDLMGERAYQPWTAYAQSKVANLLFMRELDLRARGAGSELVSAAAHPGVTATNLYSVRRGGRRRRLRSPITPFALLFGQRAATGALPQLYAATAPDVRGGDYFGPRGPAELRGKPKRVRMSKNAQDEKAGQLLWQVSEELTGVTYGLATTA